MDQVLAAFQWLQAHWLPVLTIALTVDQTLIGIFPSVAIFGSIGDILRKLTGQSPTLK